MKELGVPVVPTAARQKQGMDEVLRMIDEVASGKYKCKPRRLKDESKKIGQAVSKLKLEVESVE